MRERLAFFGRQSRGPSADQIRHIYLVGSAWPTRLSLSNM